MSTVIEKMRKHARNHLSTRPLHPELPYHQLRSNKASDPSLRWVTHFSHQDKLQAYLPSIILLERTHQLKLYPKSNLRNPATTIINSMNVMAPKRHNKASQLLHRNPTNRLVSKYSLSSMTDTLQQLRKLKPKPKPKRSNRVSPNRADTLALPTCHHSTLPKTSAMLTQIITMATMANSHRKNRVRHSREVTVHSAHRQHSNPLNTRQAKGNNKPKIDSASLARLRQAATRRPTHRFRDSNSQSNSNRCSNSSKLKAKGKAKGKAVVSTAATPTAIHMVAITPAT